MAATAPWQADRPIPTDEALALLETGELAVRGRLVEASNATLWCEVRPLGARRSADPAAHAVYKPVRGERPLDDFPEGSLAGREVAAWELSAALGWRVVPPTILRDGPHGEGALQLWIETDEEEDVFLAILARDPRLRPIALFDLIANNADRKGGHLLPAAGEFHGCDHGICFASEPKIRTVLWAWQGERLSAAERRDLERLAGELDGPLGERLTALLTPDEVAATAARTEALLRAGRFPPPDRDRRVIPWPPF